MIINICDRCGAPLPPIARGEEAQDGRIRVNGAELCGECAAEFEEFMQGAAVLKWNPVKVRPITDEEKAEQIELGVDPDALDGWIEGLTPEEGQEVLISFKNGDIGFDTVYADELGVYFDNGYEWEDVAAWAIPEPYIPDEEDTEKGRPE